MNVFTTPTANTLLPLAVRVAKILGIVGATFTAGTYCTPQSARLGSRLCALPARTQM